MCVRLCSNVRHGNIGLCASHSVQWPLGKFCGFLEARVLELFATTVKLVPCIANVDWTLGSSTEVHKEQTRRLLATWPLVSEICEMFATEQDVAIRAMEFLFHILCYT